MSEIVPYLIGDTESAARMRIASIYCVPAVVGTTGTVTAQDIAHMASVSRGTTITVTLGGPINSGRIDPRRNRRQRGNPSYGR